RVFGRSVKVKRPRRLARRLELRREGLQMRLEAGAPLQRRGLDLDEAARGENRARRAQHAAARLEKTPAFGEVFGRPPGASRHGASSFLGASKLLGTCAKSHARCNCRAKRKRP